MYFFIFLLQHNRNYVVARKIFHMSSKKGFIIGVI